MTIHEYGPRLPLVVCELANSHGGKVAAIEALIDAYGRLKYPRKAIKFQVFAADTIALPDFSWYGVYQKLEIPSVEWRLLISKAAEYGGVWIDVFDRYSTQVIADNLKTISGVKLQASVLENDEVLAALKAIDLSQLSIVLNVSGFELTEIHRILGRFRALTDSIVLQIGFQAYPTALEDTAFQKVSILRSAFPGISIGVADHADAESDFAQLAPIYGHLLGCSHIEKHFCLDRADAAYDAFSALEPSQMNLLCDRLVAFHNASSGPFVNESERSYLAQSIQIPVLRHDLPAGARISTEDLLFRRTSQQGISWYQIDALQNKRHILASDKPASSSLVFSDFRPANVAVIVACRMKSSRLPRKALLPIAGCPSVERCLSQCLASRGVDQVVLATSTLPEDAVLKDYLCDGRAKFWAGDPDDVIARYLGACEAYGIDVVVRVTADCPLVASEILEYLLESHFETGADYTAAADAAVGTAGEVINASALRTVIDRLGRAEHSEYMTWYFRNNPDVFRLNIVDLPDEWVRDYRLTLDHQEDLDLLEGVFERLPPSESAYALQDVLAILDKEPDLPALNSHIGLKYRTDEQLIAMLNEKTRIS